MDPVGTEGGVDHYIAGIGIDEQFKGINIGDPGTVTGFLKEVVSLPVGKFIFRLFEFVQRGCLIIVFPVFTDVCLEILGNLMLLGASLPPQIRMTAFPTGWTEPRSTMMLAPL